MPVLPNDILDPASLISIDVVAMLVSSNCPILEEDDVLKIVNIQVNSLDVIANQETIIELIVSIAWSSTARQCLIILVTAPN
jgi:hypothetical protein